MPAAPRTSLPENTFFAVGAPGVDGTLTRLMGEERRDSGSSDRNVKQRLVLLAIVAALLCGPWIGRRGVVVHSVAQRPLTTWWSPRAGRAPPSFRSRIA